MPNAPSEERRATEGDGDSAGDEDAPRSSPGPWRSAFRPGLFDGKVALVTGGGTGIGLAIATELAHLGATTIVASRDVGRCEGAASDINASLPEGCRGRAVAGPSTSIRDEGQIEDLGRRG